MKARVTVWVCLVVIAGSYGAALAGNGWNPPVKEPSEEPRLRRVGAEFFSLAAQVYRMVASIEDRNLVQARETAEAVLRQVGVASSQCGELKAYVTRNLDTVRLTFQQFVRVAPDRTMRLAALGVLDPRDPVWGRLRAGDVDLSTLCERTVQGIREASIPVSERVKQGQLPESLEVWRLLQAVETGSKESRYFSIMLRP